MSTEKTAYHPAGDGISQPTFTDYPTFPVTFGTNVAGPQMPVGPTGPGGPPFPPPAAFAPGGYGMSPYPQGEGSGYVNPCAPPYSPPGQGNYGGQYRCDLGPDNNFNNTIYRKIKKFNNDVMTLKHIINILDIH